MIAVVVAAAAAADIFFFLRKEKVRSPHRYRFQPCFDIQVWFLSFCVFSISSFSFSDLSRTFETKTAEEGVSERGRKRERERNVFTTLFVQVT